MKPKSTRERVCKCVKVPVEVAGFFGVEDATDCGIHGMHVGTSTDRKVSSHFLPKKNKPRKK